MLSLLFELLISFKGGERLWDEEDGGFVELGVWDKGYVKQYLESQYLAIQTGNLKIASPNPPPAKPQPSANPITVIQIPEQPAHIPTPKAKPKPSPAKPDKHENGDSAEKVKRHKWSAKARQHILDRTKGRCYLCRKPITDNNWRITEFAVFAPFHPLFTFNFDKYQI